MNAELLATVKALPREEQVQLLGEVWRSLDDCFDPPLTPAQAAELGRRLKAYEANPKDTVPWEEVEAKARASIRRAENARK
jgi:putative addiction module component (TIGR02574 family)